MNLWQKITAWISGTAATVVAALSNDEKQILALLQPLLAADESAAMQDLATFIQGVLSTAENPGAKTLADWETVILNGLQSLKSELYDLAKGLGSAAFQALIGLVLAKVQAAATATAPTPPASNEPLIG